MMARSIRARLLVGAGVGVAVAFAIAGAVVHVVARHSLYDQLDDSLIQEARALAVLVEQEGDELDTDLTPATLGGVRGRYFELFGPGGAALVRSQSLGERHLVAAALPGAGVRVADAALPDGSTGRQATYAFEARQELGDDASPIPVTLVVARATTETDDSLARLDVALAIAAAGAVVLCVALLGWITRYGLAPVRAVARRIAAIDAAAPQLRFDAGDVPVELAPITDRLDELLRRLAAVVARERELTAEVAHELRTPLAGMRSTIELALSRDREPDRYRAALADCLAIVEQTHRMIEALLALAKLDDGTVTARREPVAIAGVIDEVVPLVEARAVERRLAIEVAQVDAVALTDRDRIRVVLQNLVDNAVAHADSGGTLRISAETAGDRARIRLANTGCRIGPDAVGRVFERFWRGDPARTAGEHVGLGLALCKKLVDLVGGGISVTAELGGEFAVTVDLPRPPPGAAHGAARSS